MAKKGKKLVEAYKTIDRNQTVELPAAPKTIKERASGGKLDQTVEISMNLGVDPRHADQMVRGVVSLPHGTGKSVRIAVFAEGDKAEEAKAAGADFVGSKDLAEKIEKATRLQKVMHLLVLAKEKRFVQMHKFQDAAADLISVAQQSVEFGRRLAIRWFESELDDVEQSVLPSAFRCADPKRPKVTAETWRHAGADEDGITAKTRTLARFFKNRKKTRSILCDQEIRRLARIEGEGIELDTLCYERRGASGARLQTLM